MGVGRAWLAFGGVRYVCEHVHAEAAFPSTPVLSLVWGIYEARGERAFEALRKHIHLEAPASELCRAVVRVGAKRLREAEQNPETTSGAADEIHNLPAWPLSEDAFFGSEVPALFLESEAAVSLWLTARIEGLRTRHAATAASLFERDRAVVAALIGADGRVLLEVRNVNRRNRVRHAEMNLALGWWDRHNVPFPPGSRVAVSLKPCRMCAAMIARASGPEPVRVLYLEDDPGPHARSTCYDEPGMPLMRLPRV